MATLSFNLKDVQELADHAKSCEEHSPVFAQILDPAYAKDGTPKMSEEEMFRSGSDHVDLKKIPAGLWLVKDSGIYLMSNGTPGLMAGEKSHKIVYAKGYNPNTDEDVWDRCRDAVEGDDFGEFVPIEWLDISVEEGKRTFSIKMTTRSMSLVRR